MPKLLPERELIDRWINEDSIRHIAMGSDAWRTKGKISLKFPKRIS
jgi:hypothetical protein